MPPYKRTPLNYMAYNLTNMCQEQFLHDFRYCIFGRQERCPLKLKSCEKATIEMWEEHIKSFFDLDNGR